MTGTEALLRRVAQLEGDVAALRKELKEQRRQWMLLGDLVLERRSESCNAIAQLHVLPGGKR